MHVVLLLLDRHLFCFVVEPESSDWVPESEVSGSRGRAVTRKKGSGRKRSTSASRGRGRGRKKLPPAVPQAMDADCGVDSLVGASCASSVGVGGGEPLAGSETDCAFGPVTFMSPPLASSTGLSWFRMFVSAESGPSGAVPAKRPQRSVSFAISSGEDEGVETRASHFRSAVGMEDSVLHNEFERC